MKDNPLMYRTQSRDTSVEAERRQIERIRQMSAAQRGQMMFDMVATMHRLSFRRLRLANPNLSESELKHFWIRLNYGPALADRQNISVVSHGTK